jgi:regulator of sigma E protease
MSGFLQNALVYILPIVVILGLVVTVHELGHFLVAKWLGTKIDQFSIGFGRALAKWTDKDGVEWRVGWIPLGGYVRFAGDDNAASVPDQDDLAALRADLVRREGEGALNRYFHFKPVWQRAAITAAGPAANFLLSITIFASLFWALGQTIVPPRVSAVIPGSAAEAAGFRPNDLILSANGDEIEDWSEIKLLVMLRSDTPIRFSVLRDGREIELTATPRRAVVVDQVGKPHKLGQLGLAPRLSADDLVEKRYGPVEAIGAGAERTVSILQTTLSYLGRLFTGRETAEQLSGPLGMAQLSGDVAKKTAEASPDLKSLVLNAAITMLELAASISVGIGFLNLMPIPVLDGGHLLFYAYESVARRPLAAKVQAAGYRLGLALVLGLMLFATWNDLQRLRVFKLFGGLFS